jgi:hypothetical protein
MEFPNLPYTGNAVYAQDDTRPLLLPVEEKARFASSASDPPLASAPKRVILPTGI